MLRRAFTLIELLIVVAIIGLISTLLAGSALDGREQASFQASVQEVTLAIQELRSLAQTETAPTITGFGLQIVPATKQLVSFADKNNNGYYDLNNAADEQISIIDLDDRQFLDMFPLAYEAIAEDANEYNPNKFIEPNYLLIFFARESLSCRLAAGDLPEEFANASAIELLLAPSAESEAEVLENSPRQVLTIHQGSCLPDLTLNRLM